MTQWLMMNTAKAVVTLICLSFWSAVAVFCALVIREAFFK